MTSHLYPDRFVGLDPSNRSVITLEATVVTGLESVAAEECQDKLNVSASPATGRIFFDLEIQQVPKVLELKGINNVYGIMFVERLTFSGEASHREQDLQMICDLVDLVDWEKGFEAWRLCSGFKGKVGAMGEPKKYVVKVDERYRNMRGPAPGSNVPKARGGWRRGGRGGGDGTNTSDRQRVKNRLEHLVLVSPGFFQSDKGFPQSSVNLAGDNHPSAITRSELNLKALESEGRPCRKVGLLRFDTRHMPFRNGSVDVFVSDLPFGNRMGRKSDNLKNFYPAVLKEMARCARPGTGRAVLLTQDKFAITRNQDFFRMWWRIYRTFPINHGGTTATIFILHRLATGSKGNPIAGLTPGFSAGDNSSRDLEGGCTGSDQGGPIERGGYTFACQDIRLLQGATFKGNQTIGQYVSVSDEAHAPVEEAGEERERQRGGESVEEAQGKQVDQAVEAPAEQEQGLSKIEEHSISQQQENVSKMAEGVPKVEQEEPPASDPPPLETVNTSDEEGGETFLPAIDEVLILGESIAPQIPLASSPPPTAFTGGQPGEAVRDIEDTNKQTSSPLKEEKKKDGSPTFGGSAGKSGRKEDKNDGRKAKEEVEEKSGGRKEEEKSDGRKDEEKGGGRNAKEEEEVEKSGGRNAKEEEEVEKSGGRKEEEEKSGGRKEEKKSCGRKAKEEEVEKKSSGRKEEEKKSGGRKEEEKKSGGRKAKPEEELETESDEGMRERKTSGTSSASSQTGNGKRNCALM
ncbi:unnamed protein product [Cyprideis torosa]|uniref:Ribosomal RNA large subunit methyltransferase K/L-like methyltransferase domain-containing protein n=1 Tax=Cyprideis torosa TaxID=163714 RepID=A0A7R8WJL8_9CRUS|nr:unnamed protein product [Cyprideis torosa]CAG0899317.1 unnamed protein product [Cyprideis torosa]